MLSSIRKFSSSIYAKILLIIVIIPFVFWGMGSSFRGGNKNVIVVIDKEKFSTNEFADYVSSYEITNEKINAEKIDEILTIFIGNKLIEKEYEKHDIKLSDSSLSKLIKIQKEFKKENEFSRTEYEKFLITNQMNAVGFELNLANQEKKKQLLNYIGQGIVPPNFVVNNIYNQINQKRKIEFINMKDVFAKKFNFSEDEIKSHYEKNKNAYIETYKSVKIIEINPKKLIGVDEFNDIFYKKLDEIQDLIIQGEKIDFIINKYNLTDINTLKINKLGQNFNNKKVEDLTKNIIDNIFSLSDEEPTLFLEKKDKFYVVEMVKSENIEKGLNNKEVVEDIKLKLKNFEKAKVLSKLIAEINQKKFLKSNFVNFSKNENANIKKTTLENINDSKILNNDIVSQIYNFAEKKVNLAYDAQSDEGYLVYVDKIIKVSIDKNSDEYEKYFKLSKIKMTNELFNTYDRYIKEIYEIDINYKALKTVKNYFN